MNDKNIIYYSDDDDDTTESTEKMITGQSEGKFEIVLDIIKVNTNASIDD